jgi:hypothetical protein
MLHDAPASEITSQYHTQPIPSLSTQSGKSGGAGKLGTHSVYRFVRGFPRPTTCATTTLGICYTERIAKMIMSVMLFVSKHWVHRVSSPIRPENPPESEIARSVGPRDGSLCS